ncbi:hypothetical protein [Jonesia denitrificans]|uniref:Uncharacterized protein n=1 Tax=Jonesia denitrificans (strain ATCC 14870 / DSM 20603 / BCRC 15368 / CIP 55.134 / JCM 11481 / NBRC 15587 / NCTC 10816 / Prevot 55134) TaxID=471856 RepID=C7R1V3_JONDD|nr:hypothetical protein [Jonesia denitrificans]ACV08421.1 hypothetical protein Jden_0758 [Jonesia denitrificans DSM 20603]QXB42540.1 hypothetical protein I6L70_08230 [Jonesia denitrificans]SQH20400.1 Uncharacterised protein [Jonesia denitrificans]
MPDATATYADEAVRLINEAGLHVETFSYSEGLTVTDPQRDNRFVFAALDDFDTSRASHEILFMLSLEGTQDILELTQGLMPDQQVRSYYGSAQQGLASLTELLDIYRTHHVGNH